MNGATRNKEILATAYRRLGDTLGRSVDDWRSEFLKLVIIAGDHWDCRYETSRYVEKGRSTNVKTCLAFCDC
jgi:hypothetical protein